ncbi:hypothetical protein M885DRAFT_586730 [Pelagophyceae sp. CCMP2097]|nr:hypothetical protein M885DRAFT_586730 [Pelagophyceae sp. CCMP2097]
MDPRCAAFRQGGASFEADVDLTGDDDDDDVVEMDGAAFAPSHDSGFDDCGFDDASGFGVVGVRGEWALPHFFDLCSSGGCGNCYCFLCDAPKVDCPNWEDHRRAPSTDKAAQSERVRLRLERRKRDKAAPQTGFSQPSPVAPSGKAALKAAPRAALRLAGSKRGADVDSIIQDLATVDSFKRSFPAHVCGCDRCNAIHKWWRDPQQRECGLENLNSWRERAHIFDVIDASPAYAASVVYSLRTDTAGKPPAVVLRRRLARAAEPPPPARAALPARVALPPPARKRAAKR